ncbi:dioxygenase [Microbacterium proteolyticum]|uniref:dioxygenase n=1 Tax=Microbacterium proteolyticum TaxID=1572644 RepID=UPI0035BEF635
MATGGKDRQSRERARAYQARQELHRLQVRRRVRDNVVGLGVGLVVIAGAIGLQTAYFVAGPGAPTPAPSSTDSPSPAATDSPSPAATDSGEPDPAVSPTP